MTIRLDKLDLVRGAAALAVFLGHQRAFLFVDHARVAERNPAIDVFYALTGFGAQAVTVFFVLSGFLIGGAVHERFSSRSWSFGDYALRRLSRLWVVLLPALLFTFAWDWAGSWLSDGAGYDGRFYERYHSGPSSAVQADGGLLAFLCNMLFLQTIVGPTYGTNGPLWSLANEFWYYAMFPLGFASCRGSLPARTRWLCLMLLVAMAWLLPGTLLWGGLLWLAGYGAFVLTRSPLASLASSAPVFWTALVALASVLYWNRSRGVPYADYWIALTFAGLLPRLAADAGGAEWWRKPSRYFGNISYTLYLFHFPFLAFLAFGVLKGRQWQPDLMGLAVYCAVAAVTLAWAHLAWRLFERRTDEVRRTVKGWRRARRREA